MMAQSYHPVRVAIVGPVLARHDAISAAVRDTYRMLYRRPGFEVVVLTCRNDYDDVNAVVISGLAEMLLHPAFLTADLIVYHFGIYSELFDALIAAKNRTRQVVHFHNITPPQFVSSERVSVIEQSFRQLSNLLYADEIWAVSEVNAVVLSEQGVDRAKIWKIPLAVETPRSASLTDKQADVVEMLFIGRIVQSKGVIDLIEAVDLVRRRSVMPFRLRLAGNLEWSDQDYLAKVKDYVSVAELDDIVEFCGTVDNARCEELFHAAHILVIPSYHEGFCKPVIEGLRSGCVPVGYASYNLPSIANGFGRMVPPGDREALANALSEVVEDVVTAIHLPDASVLRLDKGRISIHDFDRATHDYVNLFTFDRLASVTLDRVEAIMSGRGSDMSLGVQPNVPTVRPEIHVIPDDTMRERERLSLNRLPDLSDWEPGGALSDLMREMNQPASIHRKSWEYALCIHGLRELGVVTPNAHALAVGAGSETPIFYFANEIDLMVATDLYDNPNHEGTPAMLVDPRAFAPFPFREDRLRVLRMPGDALEFPDQFFDFVFCLSSIEHFGSRSTQRRALDEMARVVKSDGIVCIMTELILNHGSDREYFSWEELENMFLGHPILHLIGGSPDLSISESLVRYPVDVKQSRHINRSPHIVLKRDNLIWTSFSMFLQSRASASL